VWDFGDGADDGSVKEPAGGVDEFEDDGEAESDMGTVRIMQMSTVVL
jgi:hypothetical protein